ncbi:MAG: putative Ig domain-containing protein, partial [Verrucomicrobiota bacterium]
MRLPSFMGVGLIFLFSSISEAQISITSASSLSGAAGTSVNYQITANNSPTSYSQTGLPSTMRLDSATGIISGTLPS